MTLAVTHCPVCEGRVKLQARESRLHTVYGFNQQKIRDSTKMSGKNVRSTELAETLRNKRMCPENRNTARMAQQLIARKEE
jgi:hypothetical protein